MTDAAPERDTTALDLARSVFPNGKYILVRGRGSCGNGRVTGIKDDEKWGPLVMYACRDHQFHIAKVAECEENNVNVQAIKRGRRSGSD